MIRYVFKEDFVTVRNAANADPQKIGEAIERIRASRGGLLKAEALWQEAEGNRRHPLYKHFTWDLREAAEAHWTEQARELIRVIRVVGEDKKPRRAFLSITTERDGTAYRGLDEVLSSEDLQLRVRRQALRDLEAWQKRYSDLREICELVKLASDRLRDAA